MTDKGIDNSTQKVYTNIVDFEWDENKREQNWLKHGIDFAEAALIFENPILEKEDNRFDYGEKRFIAYGHFEEEYSVVVYTIRGNKVRIISAWIAGEDEKRKYQKCFPRGVEGNESAG